MCSDGRESKQNAGDGGKEDFGKTGYLSRRQAEEDAKDQRHDKDGEKLLIRMDQIGKETGKECKCNVCGCNMNRIEKRHSFFVWNEQGKKNQDVHRNQCPFMDVLLFHNPVKQTIGPDQQKHGQNMKQDAGAFAVEQAGHVVFVDAGEEQRCKQKCWYDNAPVDENDSFFQLR